MGEVRVIVRVRARARLTAGLIFRIRCLGMEAETGANMTEGLGDMMLRQFSLHDQKAIVIQRTENKSTTKYKNKTSM